jgi:hypothetical protein
MNTWPLSSSGKRVTASSALGIIPQVFLYINGYIRQDKLSVITQRCSNCSDISMYYAALSKTAMGVRKLKTSWRLYSVTVTFNKLIVKSSELEGSVSFLRNVGSLIPNSTESLLRKNVIVTVVTNSVFTKLFCIFNLLSLCDSSWRK